MDEFMDGLWKSMLVILCVILFFKGLPSTIGTNILLMVVVYYLREIESKIGKD